jgi:uncharacterized membrane protein YfcA
MHPGLETLLLIAVGFVSSAINTVAGGGSFLSLPVLIFLGLPALEANATNRIGVVAQNVAAVWGFDRHKVLDRGWALAVSVPCMVGAALGAWVSLFLSDREFQRVLAVVMVAMTLFTIADPSKRWSARPPLRDRRWLLYLGFTAVGFYGGFVQAGVGFLVLALTTLAGLDLVRGNAVKVLLVLLQTLVALAVYMWTGKLRWGPGLALAVGSVGGALFGVRLAVLKGHAWLQRVVTITIVVFALELWFR